MSVARPGRAGFSRLSTQANDDSSSDETIGESGSPNASEDGIELLPTASGVARADDEGGGGTTSEAFPWLKVAVICGIIGSNTVSILLLVPSVPFMVRRWLPHLPLEEIGYASGALEGAFHVGQLLGAVAWGAMADRYGRRPVMLAGLVGTIVSAMAFGLAESYSFALGARLLWGLLNANIGVSKTMLAEVSGKEHKTAAFAAIGVVGAFGRLVGPSVGGVLAMPAEHIGGAFDSPAWRRFPVLLPCLAAAGMTALTLAAGFCLLEETLPAAARERRGTGPQLAAAPGAPPARGAGSRAATPSGCSTRAGSLASSEGSGGGSVKGASPGSSRGSESGSETLSLVAMGSDAESARGQAPAGREGPAAAHAGAPVGASGRGCCGPGSRWRLLLRRDVALSTSLYGALGFIGLASQECMPLLLLGDAAHGGLGMGPADIGATIAAVGPALLLFQVVAYPRMVRAAGLLTTMRVCTVAFAASLVLTPFVSVASGADAGWRWAAAIAVNVISTLARVPIFISTFVLISEAGSDHDRASVNGLGQSLCALGRITGPPIMTSLLAWSTSNNGAWPLNFHLAWLVLAAMVLAVVLPIVLAIRRKPGAA